MVRPASVSEGRSRLRGRERSSKGFSLIEVVLAIGVLSLAVVAMLGLLAPTMNSVKEVVDNNKTTAMIGAVNAQVNDRIAYEDIEALAITPDLYLYAWERQAANGNVEIVMLDPDDSFANSPNGTWVTQGPDIEDVTGNSILGPLFVVRISQLDLDGYTYNQTAFDDNAYIPFLVRIYPVDARSYPINDFAVLDDKMPMASFPSAILR
ncbi:MAG: type IV pilus modification PilV family protein [Puniceicoccales bacterium]